LFLHYGDDKTRDFRIQPSKFFSTDIYFVVKTHLFEMAAKDPGIRNIKIKTGVLKRFVLSRIFVSVK